MTTKGSARGTGRTDRDRRLSTDIERWFRTSARALPWRSVGADGRRDPYRSLVSEFMLQQTQVTRVAPAFGRFIARFPDVQSLAKAPFDEVVRQWEGLGYYRRASLLHRAAIAIVEDHTGAVPESVEALREIPGIGPYTAGAVASIVFGQRTPIVDANVRRVLLRLAGREIPEPEAKRSAWVWARAGALVDAAEDPGAFNEGLMELGAVVCLPRSPRCAECPVAKDCRARARGAQHRIPVAEAKLPRPRIVHQVVVIRDRSGGAGGAREAGRVLVEQRPRTGLWAGLWQFPTRDATPPGLDVGALRAWIGVSKLHAVGRFTRTTTHRSVEFQVWRATGPAKLGNEGRIWVPSDQLAEVAFSVPQRLIASRVVGEIADPRWHPMAPREMAHPSGLC